MEKLKKINKRKRSIGGREDRREGENERGKKSKKKETFKEREEM